MRSALGISRIRNLDISRVLHATDKDVTTLRTHLQTWGVSAFSSYPLLLRALTHPSISNWAERVLRLPPRYLGPNMLEYLGDSVVGLSVARDFLRHTREHDGEGGMGGMEAIIGVAERPSATVRAMVGNRGMAITAARMNIPELMRWEPAPPPADHRHRVSATGYDAVSGLFSNVQVNALAAAYEAIAAAVYLDAGFSSVSNFIRATLLHDTAHVRFVNTDSKQLEALLARKMGALLQSASVSFVPSRARTKGVCEPVRSFEDFQCEVLDLQPVFVNNPAHIMHYTAVILRKMERVGDPITEEDVLYVSSHFSVEGSRIAALRGAVQVVRGEMQRRGGDGVHGGEGSVVELKMREAIFGNAGERMSIRVDKEGRWMREGGYGNVKRLLMRCGVNVADMGEEDVKAFLRERERQAVEIGLVANASGGMGFAKKGDVRDPVPRLDATVVESCLQKGRAVELQSALRAEHMGLQRDILGHESLISGVCETLSTLDGAHNRDAMLKWYNEIGRQCVRLWSVQRGIQNINQDRAKIIGECEKRAQMKRVLGREMIGRFDLNCVADLQVSRPMVALGVCVEREDLGLQTALAWLSGAEEAVKVQAGDGSDRANVRAVV